MKLLTSPLSSKIFAAIKKNRWVVLSVVGLVIYFLPFILAQEESNFIIHDNLDSSFAVQVVLTDEGKTFSLNPNTQVETIMGGLPRSLYPPALNIRSFLFVLLSPFQAYLFNFLLVHITAFIGMYLLLLRHFCRNDSDLSLVALTSLCFSIIPFYSIYGLSVAGTPLLLYAFLNLLANKKLSHSFIIIGLFPMYSSFILVGIFALICLTIWGVYEFLKKEIHVTNFIKGVLFLLLSYSIVNFQFLFQFFYSRSFISHRAEFVPEKYDFVSVVDHALDFFYSLHYHVSSPVGFTMVLSIIAVFVGISQQNQLTKNLIFLLLLNLIFAFVVSIASWEMLEWIWGFAPLTKQFQWNRFYFFSPLLWYLSLWFSLIIVKDSIQFMKQRTIILGTAAFFQLFFLWKSNIEFRETSYNLLSSKKIGWSFQNFFDTKLFEEIKSFIGRPVDTYRVGSLGMHPSVAQVNGFRTADGYMPSYPLEYKHNFRKIITEEMEKPNGLKSYFDNWGSRCYLFSSELGYNFTVDKESNAVINDLRYNFNEGPKINYIFSAAKIANPFPSNLIYLKSFENPDSKWRIHLYEVRSNMTLDDSSSVQVVVDAEVGHDDVFQIYYQPINSEEYNEENAIRVTVKGRNERQQIKFRIPVTVPIKRIRLDVGTNVNQGVLKIFNIELSKGAKVIPLKLESLSPNVFIEFHSPQIILREVGGQYDPYFQFDSNAINEINLIGKAVSKL